MKKLLTQLIKGCPLLLMMIFFTQLQAQETNLPLDILSSQYTIENDIQISPTEMQFDLYLKDTDPSQEFKLDLFQAGIYVSTSIIGGGTITSTIVPGFSDLNMNTFFDTATYAPWNTDWFVIKMVGHRRNSALPYDCDTAPIMSTTGLGTRICRYHIVNTVPFTANSQASMKFSFTTVPYKTAAWEYTTVDPCYIEVSPMDSTNSFTGPTYHNIILNPVILMHTWSGSGSSDWNVAGNWGSGTIPTATDDVIIPAGCPHNPEVLAGTHAYCNNLQINGPSGISISGVMDVSGTLVNTLNGSITVVTGGALTVEGNLTNSGTLMVQTQGSLITNGTVTGTATVQRAISPDLNWHFLSSPVNGQAICNGDFAPTISTFPGDSTTWAVYKLISNCPAAPSWSSLRIPGGTINYTDFGTPPVFADATGYLVAYAPGFPTTKSFTGNLNTGDKVCSFPDFCTGYPWALIGNPYPSAIDWSKVTGKTTGILYQYYYVYNELKDGGPGYEFFKDDGHLSSTFLNGYIPSMQGFFVSAIPDGSIGIPNSSRVHDVLTDNWVKETPVYDNKLSVTLSNGPNHDEAFILFESNSNASIDVNDAAKLFTMSPVVPQVYSILDVVHKAALNSMPYTTTGVTIPLGFSAPADGNYTISFAGIGSFYHLTALTLEDLELSHTTDLMQNPEYTFSSVTTENDTRFLLHFTGTINDVPEKNTNPINIYSSQKTIFINSPTSLHNAQVKVYNLLGQQICTRPLSDQKLNKITVNAVDGYYVVKVLSDNMVKTAKVHIN